MTQPTETEALIEARREDQRVKNKLRMRETRKNQTPEQKQEAREKNKLQMRKARKANPDK